MLYRDTVSVEPGSRPFLDSVSVSKDTFMGVAGGKDTFSYTDDTFDVSTDLETGSLSVSKDKFMGIESSTTLVVNVILSSISCNISGFALCYLALWKWNDITYTPVGIG